VDLLKIEAVFSWRRKRSWPFAFAIFITSKISLEESVEPGIWTWRKSSEPVKTTLSVSPMSAGCGRKNQRWSATAPGVWPLQFFKEKKNTKVTITQCGTARRAPKNVGVSDKTQSN
jgi:hypothetical protein